MIKRIVPLFLVCMFVLLGTAESNNDDCINVCVENGKKVNNLYLEVPVRSEVECRILSNCKSEPFWPDTLADWATVVSALIALGGFIAIFYQLHDNALQARRVRAYEMSDRYSKKMSKLAHQMKTFFQDPSESRDQKWTRINYPITPEDQKLRVKVLDYFGYFEDLGAMWNLKLIDHTIIMKLLPLIIINAYNRAEWYIQQWRNQDHSDIYHEWEKMANEVRSQFSTE